MKFKKVLSLLMSATLALSSLAMVSAADITAGNLTINPTEITDPDTISACLDMISATAKENYGLFQLNFDVSGLPINCTITTSKNPITGKETTTYNGTMIRNFQFNVSSTETANIDLVTPGISAINPDVAKLADGTGIKFSVSSAAVDATLPTETTNTDNFSGTLFSYIVYAPYGTVLTPDLTKVGIFNVSKNVYGTGDTYLVTSSPVTLGTKADDKKALGLTIDGTDAKKENGYIWKLGLTQENGAKADSFTADFKDSEGLTNTKTARNSVADFFGGAGTVEFYVGLKTARIITEFKATVADSTAAGVTASDTWTAE